MDDKTRTELEAATFRRLVEHLRERTDVQNIDLMNLAGFCRNCLSKWYRAEAEERGLALTDPNHARSSTACPTTNGGRNTRRKPAPSRRPRLPHPRSIDAGWGGGYRCAAAGGRHSTGEKASWPMSGASPARS